MSVAAGPSGPPPALFDDASLPEWLRAAAADQPPMVQPAPYSPASGLGSPGFFVAGGGGGGAPMSSPPQMPSPMSGPTRPYQGVAPAGNMPANALLDASALPMWLGGSGAPQEPEAPSNALGGDGLAAGSLVDERSLPLWLRQQSAAPPASNAPPAGSVSEWLAAPVTDEPLPSWLNQVYSSAQVPRLASVAPAPSPFGPPSRSSGAPASAPWGSSGMPGSVPAGGSMPGGQLVDDAALPDWLRAQAGSIAAPPVSSGPRAPASGPVHGASGSGPASGAMSWSVAGPVAPTGGWGASAPEPMPSWGSPAADSAPAAFAASDLIDPQALPGWVQQEQAQQEFSSVTGWTNKQPAIAPPGPGQSNGGREPWSWGADAGQNNGGAAGNRYQPESVWTPASLAPAASPADEANLPPWLRTPGLADMSGPSIAGGTSGRHAARPRQGDIPDIELPPWLRSGAGPDPRAGGAPYAPPPQGWPEEANVAAAPAPAGPWGTPGPASGKRRAAGSVGMAGQPPLQYADRFGEERPGGSRGKFGYAYDFGEGGAADDLDGWDFPPEGPEQPEPPVKKRRGLFGRK